MKSKQKSASTSREALQSWRVASLAQARDGDTATIVSEFKLIKSRRRLIADDTDCSDLWVFGYGSLIYNPIIDHIQRVIASIYGYHRRFCLWTIIGRGAPDYPGLVLSLDRGGSCKGVAFQLNPENAIIELDLLWRREMITLAYQPRLLNIQTVDGIKRGIAFVADPNGTAYAHRISFESTVEVVANAAGFNGCCRDYLYDTVKGMQEWGIHDHQLEKLCAAVKHRLASN